MSDSDSDEDNVIRYGTPLEPFEEDDVPSKRKFQQQPDQYAVDVHGRRRFHGAFTGGFSAGFGNTVGTPEGWTPASFKSSRREKAQTSSQRPEDFMDEEDRSEFGIAPRHMQTQSEFSGRKRPRQKQFHDGPIPGEPVLEQMVRAVHETAAVRMLRAMGWREGQGAGGRVTRGERRRARDHHKVYGCYMPPELRPASDVTTTATTDPESDDSTGSEFDFDTLFAPDDYDPYILARKNDRFGLGYSGLSRHSVLGSLAGEYDSEAGSSRSHLLMKDKGKKVSIRGQAFGVGALEADDEDIYANADMSHYDFALGADPGDNKKTTTGKDRGTDVLEGFVKSSKPLPPVPSYPPPALPRDYTPAPAGARRSRFEPSDQPQRDQGLGRHELTPQARGKLLGETPVPKVIQSDTPVEQTNKQTDKDPVAAILGRNVNFVTTNQQPEELNYIPITDSGKEIVKVFKPFIGNPQKQTRYERYLKDKDSFALERDGEMDKLSEWERNREKMEFEQAAKLYRPLTGEMGDRFTHAAQPDEAANPLCAVARSGGARGPATAEQEEAARRGVYGALTRHAAPWRPAALLCKRFNVPDPGGATQESKTEDKPKVSYSIFSYLESSVHDKESFAKEQSKFSGSKSLNSDITASSKKTDESERRNDATSEKTDPKPSTSQETSDFNKRMTVAELFLKESEKDLKVKEQGTQVAETINKFDKMDLYKSIFLSDSEEEITENPVEVKKIDFEDYLDRPRNVERNESPPRGIFANVDFDELNSWKRNAEASKKPIENIEKSTENILATEKDSNVEKLNEEKKEDTEDTTYGPKIPDNLKIIIETAKPDMNNFKPVFRSKFQKEEEVPEVNSSSSLDSWVDVKEVKSKKQKKKKSKKHKSKHKKTRHKKKDK